MKKVPLFVLLASLSTGCVTLQDHMKALEHRDARHQKQLEVVRKEAQEREAQRADKYGEIFSRHLKDAPKPAPQPAELRPVPAAPIPAPAAPPVSAAPSRPDPVMLRQPRIQVLEAPDEALVEDDRKIIIVVKRPPQ